MKKRKEKKGSIFSSEKQYKIQDLRSDFFTQSKGEIIDKINSFTKWTKR